MAAPALAAPRPAIVTVTSIVTQTAGGNAASEQTEGTSVAQVAQAEQSGQGNTRFQNKAAAPTNQAAAQITDVPTNNPMTGASMTSTSSSSQAASSVGGSNSTQGSGSGNGNSNGSGGGSGGGAAGNKMGLAYTKDDAGAAFASATAIAAQASGQVQWMMSWEGYPKQGDTSLSTFDIPVDGDTVQFVPMLRTCKNNGDMWVNAWEGKSPKPQGVNAPYALFYNEPDFKGGNGAPSTYCDPSASAEDYVNIFQQNADGAQNFVAPAISSTPGADSEWLKPFLRACEKNKCQIDYLALHWYSQGDLSGSVECEVAAFAKYVEDFHNNDDLKYNGQQLKIWVTEFSLQANNPNIKQEDRGSFIAQAANWMDQPEQDYIFRYSPYWVSNNDAQDSLQPGNPIADAYIGQASATSYASAMSQCSSAPSQKNKLLI
ncbi:MAG: hypothetical protein Q9159_000990 [Coniocarpon cinnabarinum]